MKQLAAPAFPELVFSTSNLSAYSTGNFQGSR
jgi:hypothetical protein